MPEDTKGIAKGAVTIALGIGLASVIGALIYNITRAKAAPVVYTCPYCSATFNTYEDLIDHLQLVHPIEEEGILQ